MKLLITFLLFFVISISGFSSSISGGSGGSASQVTTAQRDALSPTLGQLVFNTDTLGYEFYDGSAWVSIGASASVNGLGDLSDVTDSPSYTSGNTLVANGSSFVSSVLAHSQLSGVGTNTHAQIDSHIANTSNPHSTTAAQVGAVALTGSESVSGVKTFSSLPQSAATPSAASDLVTKVYADALAQGFRVKEAVKAASTAALETSSYSNGSSGVGATITKTGNGAFPALDGYSVQLNERVLIKDQAAPAQNGIYTLSTAGSGAAPWVLTRAVDHDTDAEVNQGDLIIVLNGSTLINTAWAMNAADPITMGTTGITWVQAPSQTAYTAGDGLDLTGSSFSTDLKANDGLAIKSTELGVDYDDSTLGIVANKLAVKSGGIANAQINASAAIADSKLAQITTASKVHGSSITGLASTPSGAGIIPTANLGSGTADSTKFLRGDGAWIASAGGDLGTATINYNKTLETSTTQTSIAGTIAETTLYSYAVPAATLGTNKVIKMTLLGTYLQNSGANRTETIRVKYGATTLITRTTAAIAANATTGSFRMEFYLSAANSTSAQTATGYFSVLSGGTLTQFLADGGTSAIDSTAQQNFVVTVQHSNASASINMTLRHALIELVNASDTVSSTFVPKTATLTDGASVAVDASTANHFRLTATADRQISVPTNATHGQKMTILHCASGGARTLSLTGGSGGFRFGSDITALTQTESGKCDLIGSIYDSTLARWMVVAFTRGYQ